jgi:hypothetical protein
MSILILDVLCTGHLHLFLLCIDPSAPTTPVQPVSLADQREYIRTQVVSKMVRGARVVRGPDWEPGWQHDGGPGGLGTILGLYSGGMYLLMHLNVIKAIT